MSDRSPELDLIISRMSSYGHRSQETHHGYEPGLHMVGKSYKDFLKKWDLPRRSIVLDIASGMGESSDYLEQLFHATVIRTDISHVPLSLQQTRWDKIFGNDKLRAQTHALHQPLADHSVDAVHIKDALVHIEDTNAFFEEMNRILKPGGKLLIVTQQRQDKNCFYLNFEGSQSKTDDQKVTFGDAREYLGLVQNIVYGHMRYNNVIVTQISPPYFHAGIKHLEGIARNHGFLENVGTLPRTWKPRESDRDWLRGHIRSVFSFQKPLIQNPTE